MEPQKRYGLVNLKKLKNAVAAKKPSIFGDDSDEEERPADKVEESLLKESLKAKIKKQTQIEMQKALADDPTVYEYDSIYDEMKTKKKSEIANVNKWKEGKERKSKYITGLMKTAERRQREYERREERKVQKEREEEGNKYADKESYVTSSYKQKMEEMQRQEERERNEAAIDEATEVTKQKDLSGFYRHLMRQTMGEEKGQQKHDTKSSELVSSSKSRDRVSDRSESKIRKRSGESNVDGSSSRKKERSRSPSSRHHHHHHRSDSESEEEISTGNKVGDDADLRSDDEDKVGSNGQLENKRGNRTETESKIKNIFAKRNDDVGVNSARERYLARKQAREIVMMMNK